MTDLEISKALALAIGYTTNQVLMGSGEVRVCIPDGAYLDRYFWRAFDYRDWNVIGPIATKYNLFPVKLDETKKWFAAWGLFVDTPQKAIALAVIGAAK